MDAPGRLVGIITPTVRYIARSGPLDDCGGRIEVLDAKMAARASGFAVASEREGETDATN